MVLMGVVDARCQHQLRMTVPREVLEVLLRGLPVARQPAVGQRGEVRLDRRQDLLQRAHRLGRSVRRTGQDRDCQLYVGPLRQPLERPAAPDLDVVGVRSYAENLQGSVG